MMLTDHTFSRQARRTLECASATSTKSIILPARPPEIQRHQPAAISYQTSQLTSTRTVNLKIPFDAQPSGARHGT